MRHFFNFTKATASKPATLTIFDDIGFGGMSVKQFRDQLAAVEGDELIVEINSPGGDLTAGTAMHNMLVASGKKITTKNMGVVASAAVMPFLAGEKRIAPKNTLLMVHQPMTGEFGNADELRETAGILDKANAVMRSTYTKRTGLDEATLNKLLADKTVMTADEAKTNGFVTDVTDEMEVTAKFDAAAHDLPDSVKAIFNKVPPKPVNPANPAADAPLADQIKNLAETAGLSGEMPALMALTYDTIDSAKPAISAAREIVALCKFAKQDDMALTLVKNKVSVADARAQIAAKLAEASDANAVNTQNKATQTGTTQPAFLPSNMWARHNAAVEAGREQAADKKTVQAKSVGDLWARHRQATAAS